MRGVLVSLVAFASLLAGCLQTPLPVHDLAETRVVPGEPPRQGRAVVDLVTLGVVESPHGPEGLATQAKVEVRAGGSGQVFIDSPYDVARDTRSSAVDAARAASFVAGQDATAFDFGITIGPRSGVLTGPSAGSQFALGFYIGIQNLLQPEDPLALRSGYTGTGTITERGAVGPVGGVPYKVEAAAQRGVLFVYPSGPVLDNDRWFPSRIDMQEECQRVRLTCVQVDSLADLVDVAAVPR